MKHTVVFDSAKEGQWIGLACGHISLTDIVFQAENISASIEESWTIVSPFCGLHPRLLSRAN